MEILDPSEQTRFYERLTEGSLANPWLLCFPYVSELVLEDHEFASALRHRTFCRSEPSCKRCKQISNFTHHERCGSSGKVMRHESVKYSLMRFYNISGAEVKAEVNVTRRKRADIWVKGIASPNQDQAALDVSIVAVSPGPVIRGECSPCEAIQKQLEQRFKKKNDHYATSRVPVIPFIVTSGGSMHKEARRSLAVLGKHLHSLTHLRMCLSVNLVHYMARLYQYV